MSQLKSKFTVAYLLVLAVGLAGCEQPPQPYVPKSLVAPEVVYCNDNTGHEAGSKPFVLGGTCCCTPSDQLMALLHEDGQCQGMDTEALRALYVQAGISLRSENHQWCGGLCASGPRGAGREDIRLHAEDRDQRPQERQAMDGRDTAIRRH